DTSPAIVPGQPDKSLLIKAVRHEGDVKMPPKGKPPLDKANIDHLTTWVRAGAPWPEAKGTNPTASSVARARKTHWSFRPVTRTAVHAVKGADWAITPVDRFLLAKLEAKSLSPSPEADRRTLIRRLNFDLLGLPPSPEEVLAFEADKRPDAYERLVDRLLT